MRFLKGLLYWLTIVLPIIDTIKGVKKGVEEGRRDVTEERQRELWERANRD